MTFKDKKQFGEFLKTATVAQLKDNGFGCWDKLDNRALYLIPKEYYNLIPEGQTIYNLWFKEEKFTIKKHDKDSRFGLLAYGVIRTTTPKKAPKTKTPKKK